MLKVSLNVINQLMVKDIDDILIQLSSVENSVTTRQS